METVVKRHKTLGAWVPTWVAGPCHNLKCEARVEEGGATAADEGAGGAAAHGGGGKAVREAGETARETDGPAAGATAAEQS